MLQVTHINAAPVVDNTNTQTAGARGPALLQDIWLLEKLAHFDRKVIPERRMHAKGSGAFGHFKVTHDITRGQRRSAETPHRQLHARRSGLRPRRGPSAPTARPQPALSGSVKTAPPQESR